LVILALFSVFGLVMQVAERVGTGMGTTVMFGFDAVSHLATVIATAMIIFGVLQLRRRNSL